MNKRIAKLTLIIAILLTFSLVPKSNAETADEWLIQNVKINNQIISSDSAKLTFDINVKNLDDIKFLSESNTYLYAKAYLLDSRIPEYKNVLAYGDPFEQFRLFSNYPCITKKNLNVFDSREFGTLKTLKIEKNGSLVFKYNCFFPIGMKAGNYNLAIKAGLARDNMSINSPERYSWGKNQVFFFSSNSKFYKPNWLYQTDSSAYEKWQDDPITTVQLVSQDIPVQVSSNYIEPNAASLEINSKKIDDLISNLLMLRQKNLKDYASASKLLNSITIKYDSIRGSIAKLGKSKSNKNINQIKFLFSQFENKYFDLKNNLQNLENGVDNVSPKLNYLKNVNFEQNTAPEVLSVEFPTVEGFSSNSNQYLKIRTKSKTPIANAYFSLQENSVLPGRYLRFGGPILFPGDNLLITSQITSSNYTMGYGLITEQKWNNGFLESLILLSPSTQRGGAFPPSDVEKYRYLKYACGRVFDISLNESEFWNSTKVYANGSTYYGGCNPIPNTTLSTQSNYNLDDLKMIYQKLFVVNFSLQNTKQIPDVIALDLGNLNGDLLKISKLLK